MKRSHSSYLFMGFFFLTCVFWELIWLKLQDIFTSERSQWLNFEPRGDTWLPTQNKLPCELCLFVESHSKWKGWDHFDVETAQKYSTVLLRACSCCFQHCCVNVNGLLEQWRATLCMWLFWQKEWCEKQEKWKWGQIPEAKNQDLRRLHRGFEEG